MDGNLFRHENLVSKRRSHVDETNSCLVAAEFEGHRTLEMYDCKLWGIITNYSASCNTSHAHISYPKYMPSNVSKTHSSYIAIQSPLLSKHGYQTEGTYPHHYNLPLPSHPSPSLPPNLPNPPRKKPHILPLHQSFYTIALPRQLLVAGNAMHKTMTSTTQPRYIIQLIFCMPSPLQYLRMHRFGDKMVVCKWYP
jgi:hypothetical protein